MSRYIDVNEFYDKMYEWVRMHGGIIRNEMQAILEAVPYIDIVRCKECKYRPIKEDANGAAYGFNLIAPNELERCPCLVEDGWYSWMPEDNFYCGFGEREGE